MIDPYFFDNESRGFSDMTEDDLGEEYVYDTYDDIIADTDLDAPFPDNGFDDLTAMESGAAFAFAEMINDEERCDIDENTDEENWNEVMSLSGRYESGSNLRPFEQYVQSYIRRGFRHPD